MQADKNNLVSLIDSRRKKNNRKRKAKPVEQVEEAVKVDEANGFNTYLSLLKKEEGLEEGHGSSKRFQ